MSGTHAKRFPASPSDFTAALRDHFVCGAKHGKKPNRRLWMVHAVNDSDSCVARIHYKFWEPYSVTIRVRVDVDSLIMVEAHPNSDTNLLYPTKELEMVAAFQRLREELPLIREGVQRVRAFFESRAKLSEDR